MDIFTPSILQEVNVINKPSKFFVVTF